MRSRRYRAITDPLQLGQLLRDIRAYNGLVIIRAALQLAPLLFQRPGQLRFAHGNDIDLDDAVWICPPEKMKMREWKKRDSRIPAHVMPLPIQAMEILRDLHPLTGPKGPIFRSVAKRSEAMRYMSENTVNSALRTLGYDTKEQITDSGFRATARTLTREYLAWDRDQRCRVNGFAGSLRVQCGIAIKVSLEAGRTRKSQFGGLCVGQQPRRSFFSDVFIASLLEGQRSAATAAAPNLCSPSRSPGTPALP